MWGDGIDPDGIRRIVTTAMQAGYAVQNLVFGMGGGLLQKVNRDTCRFAFKCSAQQRNGQWVDVQKVPLDRTKASKAGRFSLPPVFENGVILRQQTLDQIRAACAVDLVPA